MIRRIIRGMLHIYRMYKFVKLVDKENNKLVQKAVLGIKNGSQKVDEFNLMNEVDAVQIFAEKRILFKKIGFTKAAQTSMATLKNKYLEPVDSQAKNHHVRVAHLKGLPLIDGIPFLRVGLWKAWYEEHGWLIAVFVGGFGLGIGSVVRFLITLTLKARQ